MIEVNPQTSTPKPKPQAPSPKPQTLTHVGLCVSLLAIVLGYRHGRVNLLVFVPAWRCVCAFLFLMWGTRFEGIRLGLLGRP